MSVLHLSAQTLFLRQPLSLSFPPPSYSSMSYLSPSPANFLFWSSNSSSFTTLHPANLRYDSRLPFVTRASSSGFSESIGDILGDVGIFTASGEPVMFKDLWDQKEGMAVVAFLRHFGCPCCWELASVLKEFKPRFDSAGVKLIAVGVGTPNKARLLAERLPFPMDCLYADPDRKAYDVLGLYYGFGRTFFNPASAKVFSRYKSLQKAVKNYTIEATPDDRSSVLQQGGMLIFKGKQLVYARKDEGTGDHASLNEILNICCKAPVA
ncbi:thioredoxin-like protein AAED1, chloroplastic [Telopea speciosissima]|uniref:thioredoxin-like protein AAED1, chloroplastic n=1 Tax=Telopea speciosissima TaxID=54955 RepID=UPI001CC7ADC3|nr:thioredoxin-like protein AAED1, chloroplastic [Telopea speciosissima]